MPSILLVRHAQASFGAEDYDVLSERGHEQAAAVHAAVERLGLESPRLVCGTLRRQRDTAAPFAAAFGADVEEDERWNEYHSRDVLEAHGTVPASLEHREGDAQLSSRDFQGILDDALLAWIAAGENGPAGETWPAFQGRVLGALDDVVRGLGSGESALVFTSGGPIGAVCARLLDVPDPTFVTFNHVVINAGITKLVSGRRGTSLISFNEHAHLDAELVTYR